LSKEWKPEVREVAIGDLRISGKNPRIHSSEQVEKIVRSLREFGWTNPVLADKNGTVVAGHGRLEAARKLGMDRVPVISLPFGGCSAEAYMLADNRIAFDGGWDEAKLRLILESLSEKDIDLSLTGFEEDELAALEKAVIELAEERDIDGEIATTNKCPKCGYEW